jgi:transcriptional regulator with XRE-family HTH domain
MITRQEKLETLGQRLRYARKQRHFKQAVDFARSIGMEDQRYINHENGQRTPKLPELKKYAKVLKINLTWLVDGEGQMEINTVPAAGLETSAPRTYEYPHEEADAFRAMVLNGCKSLSPEAREEIELDKLFSAMRKIFEKEKLAEAGKKNSAA